MRDVTDNVTGELDVEVKRGRGRPRKEGALTNAQRQAAYRARRRQDSVTVTKTPRLVVDQVDAYDECRLEVDALRSELNEAWDTINELQDELLPLRATKERLEIEVVDLRDALIAKGSELAAAKRGAAKSVTGGGNGNPIPFDMMIDVIERVRKARKISDQAAIFSKGPLVATDGLRVSQEQYRQLWDAICPSSKDVTVKPVTKKGV